MNPPRFVVVLDANVLFPLTLRLQKPPVTFEELLMRLARAVPDLVEAVKSKCEP
jgi:hypothetical protein